MDNLTAGLEAKEYETKTQGTRRTEAARTVGEGDTLHAWLSFLQHMMLPVGCTARLANTKLSDLHVAPGVYTIVDHGRDSRLVYELEVPQEPGDVQADFSINKTGSFVISVKVSTQMSRINDGQIMT